MQTEVRNKVVTSSLKFVHKGWTIFYSAKDLGIKKKPHTKGAPCLEFDGHVYCRNKTWYLKSGKRTERIIYGCRNRKTSHCNARIWECMNSSGNYVYAVYRNPHVCDNVTTNTEDNGRKRKRIPKNVFNRPLPSIGNTYPNVKVATPPLPDSDYFPRPVNDNGYGFASFEPPPQPPIDLPMSMIRRDHTDSHAPPPMPPMPSFLQSTPAQNNTSPLEEGQMPIFQDALVNTYLPQRHQMHRNNLPPPSEDPNRIREEDLPQRAGNKRLYRDGNSIVPTLLEFPNMETFYPQSGSCKGGQYVDIYCSFGQSNNQVILRMPMERQRPLVRFGRKDSRVIEVGCSGVNNQIHQCDDYSRDQLELLYSRSPIRLVVQTPTHDPGYVDISIEYPSGHYMRCDNQRYRYHHSTPLELANSRKYVKVEPQDDEPNLFSEFGGPMMKQSGGQLGDVLRFNFPEYDMSETDMYGRTIMMYMASYGALDEIKKYVNKGCDIVSMVDNFGNTVLHYASFHRRIELLEYLVHCCRMKEARNAFGEVPSDYNGILKGVFMMAYYGNVVPTPPSLLKDGTMNPSPPSTEEDRLFTSDITLSNILPDPTTPSIILSASLEDILSSPTEKDWRDWRTEHGTKATRRKRKLKKYEQILRVSRKIEESKVNPQYNKKHKKLLFMKRGLEYLSIYHYDEAMKDFNDSLEIDQNYISPLLGAANVYRARQKPQNALECYDNIIKLDDKVVEAFYGRGNIFFDLENYDEAMINYKLSVGLKNDFLMGHYGLGMVYQMMGEWQKSLDHFSMCIKLDRYCVRAYNARGYLHLSLKKLIYALEDFNNSLRIDQNYVSSYFGRGKVYRLLGDDAKRFQDFREGNTLHKKRVKRKQQEMSYYTHPSYVTDKRFIENSPPRFSFLSNHDLNQTNSSSYIHQPTFCGTSPPLDMTGMLDVRGIQELSFWKMVEKPPNYLQMKLFKKDSNNNYLQNVNNNNINNNPHLLQQRIGRGRGRGVNNNNHEGVFAFSAEELEYRQNKEERRRRRRKRRAERSEEELINLSSSSSHTSSTSSLDEEVEEEKSGEERIIEELEGEGDDDEEDVDDDDEEEDDDNDEYNSRKNFWRDEEAVLRVSAPDEHPPLAVTLQHPKGRNSIVCKDKKLIYISCAKIMEYDLQKNSKQQRDIHKMRENEENKDMIKTLVDLEDMEIASFYMSDEYLGYSPKSGGYFYVKKLKVPMTTFRGEVYTGIAVQNEKKKKKKKSKNKKNKRRLRINAMYIEGCKVFAVGQTGYFVVYRIDEEKEKIFVHRIVHLKPRTNLPSSYGNFITSSCCSLNNHHFGRYNFYERNNNLWGGSIFQRNHNNFSSSQQENHNQLMIVTTDSYGIAVFSKKDDGVYELESLEEERVIHFPTACGFVSFNCDNTMIAVAADSHLNVYRTGHNFDVYRCIENFSGRCSLCKFHPRNDDLLAFTAYSDTKSCFYLYSCKKDQVLYRLRFPGLTKGFTFDDDKGDVVYISNSRSSGRGTSSSSSSSSLLSKKNKNAVYEIKLSPKLYNSSYPQSERIRVEKERLWDGYKILKWFARSGKVNHTRLWRNVVLGGERKLKFLMGL